MIVFSDCYTPIHYELSAEDLATFRKLCRMGKVKVNPYEPKRIIKSGPCTIVFWNDGTKTVVKRSEDDAEDDYSAFTAALAKKVYGSTSAVKRIVERTEAQKEKKAQKEPEEKPVGIDFGKALAQALLKALEKSAMGAQKGE